MVRPDELCNLSGFHVEAFFTRLPHRECFARQRAIENDRLEQVRLAHARQIKTSVARLAAKLDRDIFAVDVIDLLGAAFF